LIRAVSGIWVSGQLQPRRV